MIRFVGTRECFAVIALLALLLVASPVIAQTAQQMAALEARLMARLEQRMAEEGEASRADQEATRLAFEQAVRATARSDNALDRRALAAIDAGQTGQGIGVLEERARARDAQATASGDVAARLARSEEWKRIGALAFLDNTARAVQAYENALQFAPDDAETLDQLAYLYERQARNADRARVGQRLAELQDPEARAKGLIHLGDVRLEENEARPARQLFEQAIAAAREAGSQRQEARATNRLAAAYLIAGNERQSEATIQQSLTFTRANNLRFEEAEALYLIGTAYFARGRGSLTGRQAQFARAEDYFRQAEAISRETGDEITTAQVQVRRGHVARMMNNNTLAEGLLREAITTFERRGVRQRLGFAQQQLASVLAEQGHLDQARPLFRSSVEQARQTNLPLYEGNALMDWSQAEYDAHNSAEACRLIRESNEALRRAEGAGALRLQTGMMANAMCGR